MEGPHTQRESRHCSPGSTALFPPANMDSFREKCPLKAVETSLLPLFLL